MTFPAVELSLYQHSTPSIADRKTAMHLYVIKTGCLLHQPRTFSNQPISYS